MRPQGSRHGPRWGPLKQGHSRHGGSRGGFLYILLGLTVTGLVALAFGGAATRAPPPVLTDDPPVLILVDPTLTAEGYAVGFRYTWDGEVTSTYLPPGGSALIKNRDGKIIAELRLDRAVATVRPQA
jgi:hypothetical protein